MAVRCRECAHGNVGGSKFCANCGARLGGDVAAPQPEQPRPASRLAFDGAERRQMTIMFCDLVNSIALSARLDPEDLRTVFAAYYREVAAEVQRFGGMVARHVGDGVLIYFGVPVAHEDDAERAVRAGLELISAIRALKLHAEVTLETRVGIATGLVVVDMTGGGAAQRWTALGDAPNLAARLQTMAEPGTLVIAPSTHRLVSTLFDCRALGPRDIKGLAEPVQAWQVLNPSDVADRFLALHASATPVVGRGEEIDLLLRRWAQAKGGEGRVVLISGEPGIGKSRLSQALDERIAREPHIRLRYFNSALHQESAFFPIIGQMEHSAGIRREDNAHTRLDKLAAELGRYSSDSHRDVALFAELLGINAGNPPPNMSPRVRMERTLAALVAHLFGLSAHQPLLITLEDAHWIDPSSHEAFQQAIERLQALPILLVITARPEFQPHWIGLPHVTLLPLNRLSRRDRMAMIENLTRGKPLPEEVTRQIVERTDGVPLFVEELTQTVVESGLLREGADRYVLYGPLPQLAIPTTLQASLMARLDRLGPVREIAQEAAAIGRDFSAELLAAVSGRSSNELATGLEQLVASGLVQRRGVPPSAVYSFKHALMQDVAYSTLLRARREALHARVAAAYEQHFRDLIGTRPELLAHHLAQAGFAERSIGFWLDAARLAISRGAATEAVAQLQRGLALLSEIPDYENRRRRELDLQIALGNALAASTGYTGTETDAAYHRARELCLEIGDSIQLVRVGWGQVAGHFAAGRQKLALAAANELLALSEQLGDAGGRQMGHAGMGASLLHLARFDQAEVQFELALAIDPALEHEWLHLYGLSGRMTSLAYMGFASALQGQLARARQLAEQSVAEAMSLAHPTSLCFAHSIASRIYYLLRDSKALGRHAPVVVRLADEHGLGLWQGLGRIYAGWSHADSDAVEAAALIADGLARYRAAGAALGLSFLLGSLASVEARAGNRQAAVRLLAEAREADDAAEERWFSAEMLRLSGEAAWLLDGDPGGAERTFRAAIALARQQGAKLWELRAATSLARLLRSGDQARAARNDLRAIYRYFTDGLSDPDLLEAKAVLEPGES